MVDVVDGTTAVAQLHQHLQGIDDVRGIAEACAQVLGELIGTATEITAIVDHTRTFLRVAPQTPIELHPSHRREIIAIGGEEQVVEQILGGLLGRRLARAHHAIDLDLGIEFVGGRIDTQGL